MVFRGLFCNTFLEIYEGNSKSALWNSHRSLVLCLCMDRFKPTGVPYSHNAQYGFGQLLVPDTKTLAPSDVPIAVYRSIIAIKFFELKHLNKDFIGTLQLESSFVLAAELGTASQCLCGSLLSNLSNTKTSLVKDAPVPFEASSQWGRRKFSCRAAWCKFSSMHWRHGVSSVLSLTALVHSLGCEEWRF